MSDQPHWIDICDPDESTLRAALPAPVHDVAMARLLKEPGEDEPRPRLEAQGNYAFGVLAFMWPGLTLLTLVLLYGIFAIVDGVLALAGAFGRRTSEAVPGWWLVITGILDIGYRYDHRDGKCTFEVLIDEYHLGGDPALTRLARIVHAADIAADLDTDPAGPGLLAIGLGGLDVEADDHQLLDKGRFVYDALYAWCQRQVTAPA